MQHIATTYRFRHGSSEIAAVPAAHLGHATGARVVALGTDDTWWLLDVDAAGTLVRVVSGPVTAAHALRVAEAVLAGTDHGSVALTTATLALAVTVHAIGEAA